MKAITYPRYGTPDVVKLIEIPAPSPKPNEALVKIAYASVNPIDWKIGEGRFQAYVDLDFPLVVGRDLAGTVAAIGDGVTDFEVGDTVFGSLANPGGAFAEFACVPVDHLAHAPRNVSLQQSASLPLVSLTCWQALVQHGAVDKGQVLFVLSGAGGTGSVAVQLARCKGAKVIATCSETNRDYVKALGADAVVDYRDENVVEAVRQFAPDGVDVVFSNLLGKLHEKSYALLKKEGILVTIGEPPVEGLATRYGIHEVDLLVEPNGRQLTEIAALIDNGKLTVPEIKMYRFNEAAEALHESMTGHSRGKIVMAVN
jgi:NADPH2:quinone reductase